jgi:hypothetical protein
MRLSVFVLVASAAAGAPAFGGTVITGKISMPWIAGKTVVYIEPGRLRSEIPGWASIFRADQNIVYRLLPAEEKFVRLTAEKMKQMATSSIGGRVPKLEWRRAGGPARFGKWACERVDVLADGKPYARLCFARISDLGLDDEDVELMRRYSAFGRPIPEALRQMVPAIEKAVGYRAYPVYADIPAERAQTTIETVEKKPLRADIFEVPAGYRGKEVEPAQAGPH